MWKISLDATDGARYTSNMNSDTAPQTATDERQKPLVQPALGLHFPGTPRDETERAHLRFLIALGESVNTAVVSGEPPPEGVDALSQIHFGVTASECSHAQAEAIRGWAYTATRWLRVFES